MKLLVTLCNRCSAWNKRGLAETGVGDSTKNKFLPRKKASLILIFPIPSSHKLDVYLWAQLGL